MHDDENNRDVLSAIIGSSDCVPSAFVVEVADGGEDEGDESTTDISASTHARRRTVMAAC